MNSPNPYAAPKGELVAYAQGPLPLLYGALTVFGCCVVGGVLGLTVGLGMGIFIPGYYRSVFAGGENPAFDPVSTGMGLGLSQGAMFGAVVGLVLMALHFWFRLKAAKLSATAT